MNALKGEGVIPAEKLEYIASVAKYIFKACENFEAKIMECNTYEQLKGVFEMYSDEIAEKLGAIDIDKYEHEMCEMENTINEYEFKVDNLEEELSTYKNVDLIQQWRNELIAKYIPSQIQPMDLEKILIRSFGENLKVIV